MTLEELSHYNGKDGQPAYVAYKGTVYDVSQSGMWKNGEHQGEHVAGVDLSEAMRFAPHGEDVFEGFKKVGKLETYEKEVPLPKQDAEVKSTITSKEKWRKWYQIYHPLDTKPEKLGCRAKVDFGYCGDIKSTLQELMSMVETKTSTDFLDKMRSLHQEIEAIYDSYVEEKGSKKIFTQNMLPIWLTN